MEQEEKPLRLVKFKKEKSTGDLLGDEKKISLVSAFRCNRCSVIPIKLIKK
jgi:hypothetical protein